MSVTILLPQTSINQLTLYHDTPNGVVPAPFDEHERVAARRNESLRQDRAVVVLNQEPSHVAD